MPQDGELLSEHIQNSPKDIMFELRIFVNKTVDSFE